LLCNKSSNTSQPQNWTLGEPNCNIPQELLASTAKRVDEKVITRRKLVSFPTNKSIGSRKKTTKNWKPWEKKPIINEDN
jgi:hypothetical protein